MEEQAQRNVRYYSISGGTFTTKVNSDHPEAVLKEYQDDDGNTVKKYVREIPALFGKIENIEFYEGGFGKNVNIYLEKDEDGVTPVISVGVANRFGEDLLKKIPSIDLTKAVRIRPFSFTPEDSKKEVRGVDVRQVDLEGKFTRKVENFFYDSKAKKGLNGYPEVDFDTEKADSDDWRMYYTKARKYTISYIEKNVLPKFQQETKPKSDKVAYPTEDINPEDIPF